MNETSSFANVELKQNRYVPTQELKIIKLGVFEKWMNRLLLDAEVEEYILLNF